MPSILGRAYRRNVPVYMPAFTDSELGLDVATHFLQRKYAAGRRGRPGRALFAQRAATESVPRPIRLCPRIRRPRRLGIFTIGGGVPRNWAQQVGPFYDIINMRLGAHCPLPRFRYGVRICPEPVHWGGLSGCTYSEGVSWGKFLSRPKAAVSPRCIATPPSPGRCWFAACWKPGAKRKSKPTACGTGSASVWLRAGGRMGRPQRAPPILRGFLVRLAARPTLRS